MKACSMRRGGGWPWGILCCAVFLASSVTGKGVHAVPVFGQRPRLAANLEKGPGPIARAELLWREALHVPAEDAQWIFYYACPDDGTRLVPETAERHRCPRCGIVYSDARTVAAHRHLLHDQLNQDCHDLAVAFARSGEERFAKPVREALLRLADLYPGWMRHDRWGRTGLLALTGGRRYAQQLDEAVSIIRLARAYDLIADAVCLSDADRKRIEAELLGAVARDILRFQRFTTNRTNHQTWFNAAYVTVGAVIGDAELVMEGLYGRYGLLWQLANSVTDDGLWYEGTIAYHFYALEAIRLTLEAALAVGIDFSENARLRSLWEGPQRVAWPNGRFPVINDSDPSTLDAFRGHYDWAERYFGAIFDRIPPAGSAALTDAGLAVLRQGEGRAAVSAMLVYGQHGGAHGHFDKLTLLLYANEREWLPDIGRLSYSVPEYETWAKTTVAHNTVVIGGRNQSATTGALLWMEQGDDWAACGAESGQAYAGTLLRRYLLLTGSFLLDVYEVEADQEQQIDWVVRAVAERIDPVGEGEGIVLGTRDGYQHLRSVRELPSPEAWSFVDRNRVLRLLAVPDRGETVFGAQSIGYRLDTRLPTILRRRTARQTRFITLYDWTGGVEVLRNVSGGVQVEDASGMRWTVKISRTGISVEAMVPPDVNPASQAGE